jgi:hypothetical protein
MLWYQLPLLYPDLYVAFEKTKVWLVINVKEIHVQFPLAFLLKVKYSILLWKMWININIEHPKVPCTWIFCPTNCQYFLQVQCLLLFIDIQSHTSKLFLNFLFDVCFLNYGSSFLKWPKYAKKLTIYKLGTCQSI